MSGKEYYHDMKKMKQIVAKFLNDMGFEWHSEHPVFVYDEKNRPRVWTPDFYIPSLQLYVEVCGSQTYDYSYREKILRKNQIQIVFLPLWKGNDEWKTILKKSVFKIEKNRHNKTMAIIDKFLSK
jgi:hypothetical protein